MAPKRSSQATSASIPAPLPPPNGPSSSLHHRGLLGVPTSHGGGVSGVFRRASSHTASVDLADDEASPVTPRPGTARGPALSLRRPSGGVTTGVARPEYGIQQRHDQRRLATPRIGGTAAPSAAGGASRSANATPSYNRAGKAPAPPPMPLVISKRLNEGTTPRSDVDDDVRAITLTTTHGSYNLLGSTPSGRASSASSAAAAAASAGGGSMTPRAPPEHFDDVGRADWADLMALERGLRDRIVHEHRSAFHARIIALDRELRARSQAFGELRDQQRQKQEMSALFDLEAHRRAAVEAMCARSWALIDAHSKEERLAIRRQLADHSSCGGGAAAAAVSRQASVATAAPHDGGDDVMDTTSLPNSSLHFRRDLDVDSAAVSRGRFDSRIENVSIVSAAGAAPPAGIHSVTPPRGLRGRQGSVFSDFGGPLSDLSGIDHSDELLSDAGRPSRQRATSVRPPTVAEQLAARTALLMERIILSLDAVEALEETSRESLMTEVAHGWQVLSQDVTTEMLTLGMPTAAAPGARNATHGHGHREIYMAFDGDELSDTIATKERNSRWHLENDESNARERIYAWWRFHRNARSVGGAPGGGLRAGGGGGGHVAAAAEGPTPQTRAVEESETMLRRSLAKNEIADRNDIVLQERMERRRAMPTAQAIMLGKKLERLVAEEGKARAKVEDDHTRALRALVDGIRHKAEERARNLKAVEQKARNELVGAERKNREAATKWIAEQKHRNAELLKQLRTVEAKRRQALEKALLADLDDASRTGSRLCKCHVRESAGRTKLLEIEATERSGIAKGRREGQLRAVEAEAARNEEARVAAALQVKREHQARAAEAKQRDALEADETAGRKAVEDAEAAERKKLAQAATKAAKAAAAAAKKREADQAAAQQAERDALEAAETAGRKAVEDAEAAERKKLVQVFVSHEKAVMRVFAVVAEEASVRDGIVIEESNSSRTLRDRCRCAVASLRLALAATRPTVAASPAPVTPPRFNFGFGPVPHPGGSTSPALSVAGASPSAAMHRHALQVDQSRFVSIPAFSATADAEDDQDDADAGYDGEGYQVTPRRSTTVGFTVDEATPEHRNSGRSVARSSTGRNSGGPVALGVPSQHGGTGFLSVGRQASHHANNLSVARSSFGGRGGRSAVSGADGLSIARSRMTGVTGPSQPHDHHMTHTATARSRLPVSRFGDRAGPASPTLRLSNPHHGLGTDASPPLPAGRNSGGTLPGSPCQKLGGFGDAASSLEPSEPATAAAASVGGARSAAARKHAMRRFAANH